MLLYIAVLIKQTIKHNHIIHYLLVFLITVLSLACVQNTFGQRYNFRNYSVEQGVVQAQITALVQDKNAIVWIGTANGLTAFNGKNFTNYTIETGLINNGIRSLLAANDSSLWIGTLNGISVFKNGVFKNYPLNTENQNNQIYALFQDSKNKIWVGTKKGLCYFENDSCLSYIQDTILSKSFIYSIYEDTKNNLWFCTIGNGLVKFDGKKFIYYNQHNGLEKNISSVCEDTIGNIWVGGFYNGIYKLEKNNSFEIMPVLDIDDYKLTVQQIIKKQNGNILFATFTGLYEYQYKIKNNVPIFKRYSNENGLENIKLLSLTEDTEQGIWIGTNGGGIYHLPNQVFFNFSGKQYQFKNNYINTIYADKHDNIWIASENNGVYKMFDYQLDSLNMYGYTGNYNKPIQYQEWNTGHKKNRLIGNRVYDVAEANDGSILFATNNGLSVFSKNKVKDYTLPRSKEQTYFNAIFSILPDNDFVWLGTANNGVAIFNGDSISFLNKINKHISSSAYTIFKDKQNNYWIGTDSGAVYCTKNNVIEHYTKTNGFIDMPVKCITQDGYGSVWLGTSKGVYVYRNGRFTNLNINNGLISNTIYSLQIDMSNNIWIGTVKGLNKIDLNQFYNNKNYKIEYFGKQEGFMGIECNLNAVSMSKNGMLWFGTIDGVTACNPKLMKKNVIEPHTIVSKVQLFYEDFDYNLFSENKDTLKQMPKKLVLPHNKNYLTFHFIGVSHTNPEKVLYKFKLEGLDENWSPVMKRTEITYAKVPPGTYVFKVIACNNDGLWNSEPATFPIIIIKPPFYKTKWFISLMALLIIAGIYFYIKLRTKKLLNAKKELEKQVSIRTKELRIEKEKVEKQNDEIFIQKENLEIQSKELEKINNELTEQKDIIEERNRNITSSINYAQHIQTALLSDLDVVKQFLPNSFVFYKPRDIVSGDFYWIAKKNEMIIIAAADCTGHGVPGAFMSILGNSLLNEIINDKGITQPDEILNNLRSMVIKALKQRGEEGEAKDGMDIALVAYDVNKNILQYAGANNPLYLIRKNELIELKANKSPIGIHVYNRLDPFTNHEINLEIGDAIYLFSDGFIDQFGGPKGKKLLSKRFKKILLGMQTETIDNQKIILDKALAEWQGSQEQVDDIIVIGVKF